MAYRDLLHYANSLYTQYTEMLKELKDFEEELKNGSIEESVIQRASNYTDVLKTNCERVNYLLYLLARPSKKKLKRKCKTNQRLKYINKKVDKELRFIYDENKQALQDLNHYLKTYRYGEK